MARFLRAAAVLAVLSSCSPNTPAYAAPQGMTVIRAASGATALVAHEVAAKFQALVAKLEAAGARIKDMGGMRHTRIAGSGQWSKHSIGHAIDICQRSRNVVDRSCYLPANATEIAESVGLRHGGAWRNADTGHFETPGPNPGGGGTRYASRRHHKHVRTIVASTDKAVGTW